MCERDIVRIKDIVLKRFLQTPAINVTYVQKHKFAMNDTRCLLDCLFPELVFRHVIMLR